MNMAKFYPGQILTPDFSFTRKIWNTLSLRSSTQLTLGAFDTKTSLQNQSVMPVTSTMTGGGRVVIIIYYVQRVRTSAPGASK